MAQARQQVMLEHQAKTRIEYNKLKRKQDRKGMIVKIDENEEEEQDRIDTISVYDAIFKNLSLQTEAEKTLMAEIDKSTPNFMRNFYKHNTQFYTKKLTTNELVVQLHKELLYADSEFMVFNKPYGIDSRFNDNARSLEQFSSGVKRLVYGGD